MVANPLVTALAHPLPVALAVLAVALWAATEFNARRSTWRQGAPRRPGSARDHGTYPAIVFVVVSGLVLSVLLWWIGLGGYLPVGSSFLGLAVVAGGLALRSWALRSLGRFFTMPITIREDHRIVTTGPYRWLRHPAYTASILVSVGLPLILGTLVGVAVTLALCLGIYLYRIAIEEGALTERFGEEYRAYRRATWALVPFIF
jgi:protein-S-isoprenylcysteine O-methyltransferase Ste14